MATLSVLREELDQALKEIRTATESPQARDDLETLQRLLWERREPRIALVGSDDVSLEAVLGALGVEEAFEPVREKLGRGRWYAYATQAGELLVADLRGHEGLRALEYHAPDAILAVTGTPDEATVVVEALSRALEVASDQHDIAPVGLVAVFRGEGQRSTADFRTLQAVKAEFARRELPRDWVDVECVAQVLEGRTTLATPLVKELPMEVRFSLARMADDVQAKRAVAFELVRLASTLNAAIASVPIPVASAVPITTIQIAMIGSIATLSGRPVNTHTVGEFAAAVGVNLGAAVALREIARALISLIPVAGPAISASIAAGATLTLGKAATRHYLDA